MSEPTSKITVQNSVTDTARIVAYSELNASTITIPWSVLKSDLNLSDDSVVTINASQAINNFNTIYFVNATTSSLSMTLASAANMAGKWITFKKIDGTVNTVTLNPGGGDTIDSDTSLILAGAQAFVKITSDGTNWKITDA